MVFCLCRTTVASVQDDRGETAQHHLRSRHLPGEEEGRKQGQTNDDGNWQAPEPYPSLSDYNPHGQPPVPLSPDPLVSYTWSPATTNASHLQSYRLTQSRHEFIHRKIWPKSAVTVLENGSIQIHDTVTIQWDWGVERAAWFEVMVQLQQLQDFDERDWKMEMALSEFNSVYPGKRRVPQQYPNTTTASRSSTYRLETNDELYEGVRFTWLFVTAKTKSKSMFVQGYDDSTTTQPLLLTLEDASIVSKIKPISYTGKFASSCPRLTQIWYTGAYGVRLNMEATQFNSILVERGDRVAIQGDGHPTMATALLAFGGQQSSSTTARNTSGSDGDAVYDLVWNQLWMTNSGHIHGHHVVDDYIMAYPLYWIGSVLDWYWATGDHDGFEALLPDVLNILDDRIGDFMNPQLDIGWMGWDDRLGNGWCFHSNHDDCGKEGHLAFGALVTKVTEDVARALIHLPHYKAKAKQYKKFHKDLIQQFRQLPEYPHSLGVHAAGNALSSGIASPSDIKLWMRSTLNDIVTICSWSAFNQYWILQGLGAAEQMEHAIASIQTCWGSMLDTGKGCFYELYAPEWSNFRGDGDRLPTTPSMCHPWASGVTAWMSSALLGIQPITPGYSKFVAAPYVSTSYPSVNGTVPTPMGGISVEAIWKTAKTDDEAASMGITLLSPKHTKGYIGVRRNVGGCELNLVQMNGAMLEQPYKSQHLGFPVAKDWSSSIGQNIFLVRADEGGAMTTHVTASYHCPSTKQSTTTPDSDHGFPPAHYPASVSTDRTSQGDGLHEHGSDGYILLGVNEDGSNEEQLPSYISSVSIYQHGFSGYDSVNASYVGTSSSNKAYLPYQGNRSLGLLGDDDDSRWYPYRNPGIALDVSKSPVLSPSFVGRFAGQGLRIDVNTKRSSNLGGRLSSQGFLVDVNTTSSLSKEGLPAAYKLSLYCVANTEDEQFAIRVMDLTTLNVIAPTLMIDKHQQGVWWTVEYDKSLRLRIMSVYGMHISAVAFSSSKPKGIQFATEEGAAS